MKTLPDYVTQSPKFLYIAALVMFLGSTGLGSYELWLNNRYGSIGDNPSLLLQRLRVVLDAANNAIYLAANGVILHVMLAIWNLLVGQFRIDNKEVSK
jgi:uncharacterized membrane protein